MSQVKVKGHKKRNILKLSVRRFGEGFSSLIGGNKFDQF